MIADLTASPGTDDLSAFYNTNGFCLAPTVLPPELIGRAVEGMDAVMRGEYETGEAPRDLWWKPSDPANKLRKIDQAHVSNRAIFDAVTHPDLGRLVAEISGAKMVQVWCVQLLHKPPGGDSKGAVGWHQDYYYWKDWWTPESQVFTAWLALSDVREECGPMHFVPGSHQWGLLKASDFFGAADEKQRQQIPLPPGAVWREQSGAMPAGAFSLHHRLTFHGSQPNLSNISRYSFAIHLRTGKSTPLPDKSRDYDYVSYLDDPSVCPVIHGAV